MPYTINYNPTLDVIEIIQTGVFTANDIREVTSTFIELGRENKCTKLLVDMTNNTVVDASLFDILNLPAKQYLQEGADRNSRIAVLLPMPPPPQSQEAAKFYENACQNRGWMAKVFNDRQAALAWLSTARSLSPEKEPAA